MADVPGVCELSLTRAVVQYGDAHEMGRRGGLIADIGMAVVLAGRFASAVRAVDLGSGTVKDLNLTTDLVILDWVHQPALAHLDSLAAAAGHDPGNGGRLRSYCFDLATHILDRRGFTPLTRPVLLRIGYRDLCRDLDLHDHARIRVATGPDRIATAHLDFDSNALIVRTSDRMPDPALAAELGVAFQGLAATPPTGVDSDDAATWRIPFGIPATIAELRRSLEIMRRGLNHLVAHFEPVRHREIGALTSTFGERATLDRLRLRPSPRSRRESLSTHPAMTVH